MASQEAFPENTEKQRNLPLPPGAKKLQLKQTRDTLKAQEEKLRKRFFGEVGH